MAERGPDGFLLDEPARVIPGGSTRKSVRVDRDALPNIARRERLDRALIRHDGHPPSTDDSVASEDVPLLRLMAEEALASGVPPVLRYQALLFLGHLGLEENRGLLEALASGGDDAHVRGFAAVALGRQPVLEQRTDLRIRRITGGD